MRSLILIFFIFTGQVLANSFPVSGPMRTRVNFWKRVYTEINHFQAFLHDKDNLTLIYRKVDLPQGLRKRGRQAKREKRKIAKILKSVAKKNYNNLNKEEQKIAKIIGKRTPAEIKKLIPRIRYQYGLKDRYYQGLIRSYAYIHKIKKIFKKNKLPDELSYLPHVESSFNYHAYSKVGAAGIWQFMRSTARRYGLKVSYVVDERKDPIKATNSAAKFLKDNYRMLKSWPLALTAYNHGPRSVQRAVRKLNTTNINKIIENYDGKRFGFASKNFYATFMATVEISKKPEQYFRAFKKPTPFNYTSLKLDHPYSISHLVKHLKINPKVIKEFNPSIRRSAYYTPLNLPKGFVLNLPVYKQKKISQYRKTLASIKKKIKSFDSIRLHIVSHGENLYDIARIHRISLGDIIQHNRIKNPSLLYPGMKIKIPGKLEKDKLAKVKKKAKSKPPLIASIPKPVKFTPTPKPLEPAPTPEEKETKHPRISLTKYNLALQSKGTDIYQIEVETEETLGHYADWLDVATQNIRDWNGFASRSFITFGQKLLLKIPSQKIHPFKEKRNEFHIAIQEDFYSSFKLAGTKTYTVKSGDTLSHIMKKISIPYWLMRKYQGKQPGLSLSIAQELTIPLIEEIKEDDAIMPKS